jgi:molybdate transport system substrate-binding protein
MTSRRLVLSWLALGGAAVACGRGDGEGGPKVDVAAAADLNQAFEEIGRAFQRKTGIRAAFRFGSSGLLAQQVAAGAPFDVFASADIGFVDQAVANGACDGATRQRYARGRIVVWTRGEDVASLAALADPRFKKIAIAHPDHAPYGKAAQQALERDGVWDQVKDRLVYGENVRQALQWAQAGSADAAIVALSLAVVTTGGKTLPIDEAKHEPLIQAMAVCKNGGNPSGGRAFVDFVGSPEGVEIMKRYGFARP